MSYYFFNRERKNIENAKDKYHSKGGKKGC